MMGELNCPYCGAEQEHPEDCYEQDRYYESQCIKCEKNFVFTISFYPHYSEHKADCLNGGEHKWEKITGYPEEFFENKRRCADCDRETTIEKKRLGLKGGKEE